jgi:hypothetical protein
MKPRQQAVLLTVRQWARATVLDEYARRVCPLCHISCKVCDVCPYVEVFEEQCVSGFLHYLCGTQSPRRVLRRAMTLARQFTVGDQALDIVRDEFGAQKRPQG